MPAGAVRRMADGIAVTVRLTPRARADEVAGTTVLSDGRAAVAMRVRALPAKGAANTALERMVAAALDVSRGSVSVVSGHKDRLKIVHVAGDPAALMKRAGERFDGGG